MTNSRPIDQTRRRLERLTDTQRRYLAVQLIRASVTPTVHQGSDRLVACVVPAVDSDVDVEGLRQHVSQQLSDYMVPQVIVVADALPRTAAGKLDRHALQHIEINARHEPQPSEFVEPSTDAETTLAEIWSDVLGLDEVSTNDNFFEVGGDSLLSIRILARANRAGLRISPEKFFAHPTIAEQAIAAEPETNIQSEQGFVTGQAPLIPIQHWFFENVTTEPQRWNQAPLYALSEPVQRVTLERAVQVLVNHHDVLRSRFIFDDSSTVQDFSAIPEEPPVHWKTLSSNHEEAQIAEIEVIANAEHGQFELARGPLIKFLYFSTPQANKDFLLIIAHHLIVDAVSWRLLVEDLTEILNSLELGSSVELPRKTTPLREWATRLLEHAESESIQDQATYWADLNASFELPLDFAHESNENRVETAFTVTKTLEPALTSALVNEVPKAFRTRINDALLAPFVQTLSYWSKSDTVRFDLEGHGREPLFDDVDLSRTFGWLTTVYPVQLRAAGLDSAGDLVKNIKDQLRAIPSNGIGHGLLRYLSKNPELADRRSSQVLFNYLGRLDHESDTARLQPVAYSVGQTRAETGQRIYRLEIDSRIQNGSLVLDWTASDSLHKRVTIENLAEHYLTLLRHLVAAATAGETSTSADDFPLADLDAAEMENLAEMLKGIDDDS